MKKLSSVVGVMALTTHLLAQEPVVEIPSGLEKGYQLIVETGFGTRYGDDSKTMANIDIVNGIRFSPNFSLGIGTGIRGYVVDYVPFLLLK